MHYYGDSPKVETAIGQYNPRLNTLREKLTERKKMHEQALAEVNEALACIDKNPEFEKFHDAVSKSGF